MGQVFSVLAPASICSHRAHCSYNRGLFPLGTSLSSRQSLFESQLYPIYYFYSTVHIVPLDPQNNSKYNYRPIFTMAQRGFDRGRGGRGSPAGRGSPGGRGSPDTRGRGGGPDRGRGGGPDRGRGGGSDFRGRGGAPRGGFGGGPREQGG